MLRGVSRAMIADAGPRADQAIKIGAKFTPEVYAYLTFQADERN